MFHLNHDGDLRRHTVSGLTIRGICVSLSKSTIGVLFNNNSAIGEWSVVFMGVWSSETCAILSWRRLCGPALLIGKGRGSCWPSLPCVTKYCSVELPGTRWLDRGSRGPLLSGVFLQRQGQWLSWIKVVLGWAWDGSRWGQLGCQFQLSGTYPLYKLGTAKKLPLKTTWNWGQTRPILGFCTSAIYPVLIGEWPSYPKMWSRIQFWLAYLPPVSCGLAASMYTGQYKGRNFVNLV